MFHSSYYLHFFYFYSYYSYYNYFLSIVFILKKYLTNFYSFCWRVEGDRKEGAVTKQNVEGKHIKDAKLIAAKLDFVSCSLKLLIFFCEKEYSDLKSHNQFNFVTLELDDSQSTLIFHIFSNLNCWVASKLYGVNAPILILVFVLYCIVFLFIQNNTKLYNEN